MRSFRRIIWVVAAAFVVLCCAIPPASQTAAGDRTLILAGGKIYTSPTAPPIANGVLLVQDGKIAAVGKSGEIALPAAAQKIDCTGLIITAGFQNSHVHFTEPKWDDAAHQTVALLRTEAGRVPHDRALTDLVGQLSTRSDAFRTLWASHDVREHRTGIKIIHHPVVGDINLSYEAMDLTTDRGLLFLAYTAAPGTPSDDALRVLMSWAATHEQEVRGSPVAAEAGGDSEIVLGCRGHLGQHPGQKAKRGRTSRRLLLLR